MAAFIEQVFLLFRSEQLVERVLRRLHREEEIVLSVQHQRGLLNARQEVDGIGFSERWKSRPPRARTETLMRGSIGLLIKC